MNQSLTLDQAKEVFDQLFINIDTDNKPTIAEMITISVASGVIIRESSKESERIDDKYIQFAILIAQRIMTKG